MSSMERTQPDVILATGDAEQAYGEGSKETVEQPDKVMRIGSIIKHLLDEVRQAPLDEASLGRLREIYDRSIEELAQGLSPDLREELTRMTSPFGPEAMPSDAELR